MNRKDSNGKAFTTGDFLRYQPDLDSMEEMWGTVPEDHHGDVCECKTLGPNPYTAFVTFADNPKVYKVPTRALVFVKQGEINQVKPPANDPA